MAPVKLNNKNSHASELESLFIERLLSLDASKLDCGWEDILIPQGMMAIYQEQNCVRLLEWVKGWLEYHMQFDICEESHVYANERKKGFVLNDYCGNWGAPMVLGPICQFIQSGDYKALIEETCSAIERKSVRLKDGVIAHGGFAQDTVWVDTLYYSASPLAHAYCATKNEMYAREAVNQCLLHSKFLRDEVTGCFFHDVNPEKKIRTNWFWSRGNGWIIMALADTLRHVPSTVEGWNETLDVYLSLCTGLLRYQHSFGLWRIVPEFDESHLETSGSTMILNGLIIGVNEGWLEPSVQSHIDRGYQELKTWIDPESGALTGSQKPVGCGGWETHKRSAMGECTYASGILLRLIAEYNRKPLPSLGDD